jgi:ribosomal protein L7/L12
LARQVDGLFFNCVGVRFYLDSFFGKSSAGPVTSSVFAEDEITEIKSLLRAGKGIAAIKRVPKKTGVGVVEAKQFVEKLGSNE